jgi:aryl-alcohol dehydrogenase-like predicted oxidoreductase
MSKNIKKISIGSANFGQIYSINKVILNKKKIHEILDLAKKNKIYSIDTAQAYKNSEKKIGEYINFQKFKNWDITTKVLKQKRSLIDLFKKSKNNLLIKPNNLLVHNSKDFLDDDFRNDLIEIKKKENIKIGVSIYHEKDLLRILDKYRPDIIQIPINILDKKFYSKGLISDLKKEKINIQARSIFFQGILFQENSYIKKKIPSIFKHIYKLRTIAYKNNLSLGELSLSFVAEIREVDKIIIGINNVQELKTNIKTLKSKISSNTFNEIMDLRNLNINFLDILSKLK